MADNLPKHVGELWFLTLLGFIMSYEFLKCTLNAYNEL
jgi:hypothetical protein